jgi:hypothetical protein
MNISAIKAFAPAVRRQLMEAITRKLDFVLSAKTPDYLSTFAPQVASLRKLAQDDRPGLIERVAYTWFNRLMALRFLDATGWHPFRARVLTAASASETQPEVLKLARAGELPEDLRRHTNLTRLGDLLDARIPSSDPQGEVYRYLILAACRFYHDLLPDVFERLDDETELLLPDDLLTEHSVVHGFRTEVSDEDCGDEQGANVEILGWLYQFYISERKDQVMARKSAVPKEDIPAVTQLFTPHWIVRYLVENSLGRLWLLNRPDSRLRELMPYYIEGQTETDFLKINRPEEIRVLDPAAGSGHMLTYAFDLFYAIYEEEGYPSSDIPALILKHNLHGLEICPRAAQLAELALLFKAREKSRRFFQPEYLVRPNVMELREVRFAQNELRDYTHALGLGELFNESLLRLMYQFEEAKNFGSLIKPCLGEHTIAFVLGTVEAKDLGSQLFLHETHHKVLRVLEQAESLSHQYAVVVANPPYMGSGAMNAPLKEFAKTHFPNAKSDLFAMLIVRCLDLTIQDGFTAMITMQSWMFLSSFEQLRASIFENSFATLLHIGYNTFPELNSKIAQGAGFVLIKKFDPTRCGVFIDLNSAEPSADKHRVLLEKLQKHERFEVPNGDLKEIPGNPIAYWASKALRAAYREHSPLKRIGDTRQGMATSDNGRFLRLWYEVARDGFKVGCKTRADAKAAGAKWIPYNKGGESRKWWGNQDYVLDWRNDGEAVISYAAQLYGSPTRTIKSLSEYFKPCISWSKISWSVAFRYFPSGFIFDVAGCCIFFTSDAVASCALGFLNSRVAEALLATTSPTLNFEAGHVAAVPFSPPLDEMVGITSETTTLLISIARTDWDNFETSWDFRDQPLLRPCLKSATLEVSWRNLEAQCTAAIRRMQELETRNNRLFIDAYGLQNELYSEVPEEQITLARADARRDVVAFLSYAVGCMMGRYSPDHPGLILANAGDSMSDFLKKVNLPLENLTFVPNEDAIIPVLDGEWFENDIVARTREFLRATFGEATLRENVRFIEDSLGKDLRKYFVTDFYKNHLQTYKKRPIYWMMQSPRKSFSVLIYLHRYTRDTVNLVLNRYLREYELKLRNRIEHLVRIQADAGASPREKTIARKESDKLIKALHDCEDWERQTVLPLAQARIELDLDDGVKANYLKLGEVLAPIPGLAVAEED